MSVGVSKEARRTRRKKTAQKKRGTKPLFVLRKYPKANSALGKLLGAALPTGRCIAEGVAALPSWSSVFRSGRCRGAVVANLVRGIAYPMERVR